VFDSAEPNFAESHKQDQNREKTISGKRQCRRSSGTRFATDTVRDARCKMSAINERIDAKGLMWQSGNHVSVLGLEGSYCGGVPWSPTKIT
jgi:hypothetical protein